MSRRSEARRRAAVLARRRDDTREALEQVRSALGDVGGTDLRGARPGKAWVLPIAAGAVGIAIAWSLRRFRNR